jgi:serine-type D-Ala-D-Ala carboxypeptidase/endopeptidase
MKTAVRFISLSLILLLSSRLAAAEDAYTYSIPKFLHDNVDKSNTAMVIGLVDEHGSRVFSTGKLGNGTDQEVNGDTIFAIGSNTKTFDVLLLEDMVERGEMQLNDPVSKYLPQSVKMPTHGGTQITLLDLATHTSGLPFDADDFTGAGWREHFENYSVEKLYAWLSSHTLRREPGTQYAYSNAGMALLAHVISLKAGKDYESLVVDRICHPLHMNSTGITLTPELRARLAVGHDKSGKPEPVWDIGAYAGAGALRSTANDLLKYVAANTGLFKSTLTPLMEKTQIIRHKNSPGLATGDVHGNTAMAWMDFSIYQPPGMELLMHAGGISGYSAFIGFDKKQRRGVVVLASQRGGPEGLHPIMIGCALLQRQPLTRESATVLVLELVGIGAALDLDQKSRAPRITKIIPKSPASLAGLSAGLVIQKIDGVATAGKTLAECVALIRGPPGTKVRLEVVDPIQNKTQTFEITRQRFQT